MNDTTNTDRNHPTHVAILRDLLPVAIVANNEASILRWFHTNTPQSMDWELMHGGYWIEWRAVNVRGWQAFDLYAGRRGYGVAGSIARLAVEIQALVTSFEGSEHAAGEWRDAVAAPAIANMLCGFIGLLNFTDSGNSFDDIRGDLDMWARLTAERIGENGGEL